ncbi:MAG: FHA domain-containing protein [Anaerolineae bacterium]|jgi:pSer/pThr/pTyr-binding forkhead associated (FHA) protein|nr:FHA domain-containing protein [Anaerolineae bacterium]
MPAQLIMRRGPEVGRIFVSTGDSILIGRGVRNHIIIDDNEVSREHCRLLRSATGYELCDLSSRNGTFVNGHRVSDCWPVKSNDIIELGDSITLEMQIVETETLNAKPSDNQPLYLVVIIEGQSNNSVYPLQGESIQIGRGTMNDIILLEPEVSRQHLRFDWDGSGYMVRDTGSTNGSKLNDIELLETSHLKPGDIVRIGQTIRLIYTTNPDSFTTSDAKTSHLVEDNTTNSFQVKPTTQSFLKREEPPSDVVPVAGDLSQHAYCLYVREDWQQYVAMLVNRLMDNTVKVWVEQHLPVNSEDWKVGVDKASTECWALIVVYTPKALQSPGMQKIIRRFSNREKPIFFCVTSQSITLPVNGSNVHRIILSDSLPELSIQQLVRLIRNAREGRA